MKHLAGWESYDALQECIGRDTVEVALALHLSEELVCKWKKRPVTPEDFQSSGARNPLDRLVIIVETILKKNPERAYLPIMWLCVRFGFLPPVKMPEGKVNEEKLLRAILEWNREFGQTCEAISVALKDGRVSPPEYKKCLREAMEGVGALMSLLTLMKEQAG